MVERSGRGEDPQSHGEKARGYKPQLPQYHSDPGSQSRKRHFQNIFFKITKKNICGLNKVSYYISRRCP